MRRTVTYRDHGSIRTASGSGPSIVSYRAAIISCCTLLALGCKTTGGDQERPALIVEADDASRADLQQAVNTIIGTEVMLSATAFTERSVLVIENWPRGTMQNPVPQGRTMEAPVRLQLVTIGGGCLLIDTRDGSQHPLRNVNCVAE